jgi:RNA-binding protein
MAITSRQRAKLRSLAQSLESIAQFGKNEITPEQVEMIDQMLEKRELIKCTVLETSPYTAREACGLLAEKTGAEPVQAIGRRFVLYRRNPEHPSIELD